MTTTATAPTTAAAELRRRVGDYAARFDPALVTAVDAAGLVLGPFACGERTSGASPGLGALRATAGPLGLVRRSRIRLGSLGEVPIASPPCA